MAKKAVKKKKSSSRKKGSGRKDIKIDDLPNFGFRADPPSQLVSGTNDVVWNLPSSFQRAFLYFPNAKTVFEDTSEGLSQLDLQEFPKKGADKGTITMTVRNGLSTTDKGTFQYAVYREKGGKGEFAEGNSPPEVIIE